MLTFPVRKTIQHKTNLNIVVKSDLSKSVALGSTTITGTNGPGVIKGAAITASVVTLETFLINIEDIEFEMDDDIMILMIMMIMKIMMVMMMVMMIKVLLMMTMMVIPTNLK